MLISKKGFISAELATKRKEHFLFVGRYAAASKYKILSGHTEALKAGQQEAMSVTFQKEQFNYLVNTVLKDADGLRIYFAGILKSSIQNGRFPSEAENKLTLVFAPTMADNKDREDYYIYNSEKNAVIQISKKEAMDMVTDFQHGKLSLLEKAERIDNASFNETKCIFYPVEYLINWKNYANNPEGGKPAVRYVDFEFAAYLENDVPVKGADVKHQLSLNVQFLDDAKRISTDDTGDTGIPCPPYPQGQTTC